MKNLLVSLTTLTALLLVMILPSGCSRHDAETPDTPDPGTARTGMTGALAPAWTPDEESPAAPSDPDEVLVRVNGDAITRAQADVELNRMMAQYRDQIPPEQLQMFSDQMLPQALETMINRKLLRDATVAAEIEVPEERVDTQLDEIAQSLPDGLSLEQALAMQGMNLDALREQIREGLRVQQLVEGRTDAEAAPSDADVQKFYDENPQFFDKPAMVTARHILFSVGEDDDDETRAAQREKAATVRQALLDGGEFEALAREHSSCPSSEEDGKLPPFGTGQMVPEFEAAAFALAPGALSDLVETQFGYHIIRLEERTEAGVTPIAEVSEDIQKHLQGQRRNEAFEKMVDSLRQDADIQYADPSLAPPPPVSVETPPASLPLEIP